MPCTFPKYVVFCLCCASAKMPVMRLSETWVWWVLPSWATYFSSFRGIYMYSFVVFTKNLVEVFKFAMEYILTYSVTFLFKLWCRDSPWTQLVLLSTVNRIWVLGIYSDKIWLNLGVHGCISTGTIQYQILVSNEKKYRIEKVKFRIVSFKIWNTYKIDLPAT